MVIIRYRYPAPELNYLNLRATLRQAERLAREYMSHQTVFPSLSFPPTDRETKAVTLLYSSSIIYLGLFSREATRGRNF